MNDGIRNISQRIMKRKFSSIFLKNLSLMSIVILLPMVIVIWVTTFSFNAFIDKEIHVYSNKSLAMIIGWTSNMISDCLQQMNYMASDNDTTVFLISEQDQEVSFYDEKSLFKLIAVQMRTKKYLSSIYIYSEKNNLVFSNYGLTKIQDFYDTGWYEEFKQNELPGRFFCTFRYANSVASTLQKPTQLLSLYNH